MTAEERDARLGAIALGVFAVLLVVFVTGLPKRILGSGDSRTVHAVFGNALQLKPGSDVRVDGVNEGKVTAYRVDPATHTSTVTMDVKDTAGHIYDDAHATIRVKTVLGGAFYVDLDRGTAGQPALADGGTIPQSRTAYQVELDDVVDEIDGGARRGLQILPGQLADAFRDHQAPARLFDTVDDISPGATVGLQALRGRIRDTDLQGVLKNVARTVDALNTPRDDIRTVIEGAAATLQTTANRADDIRATIGLAPGTMTQVDAALTRLRRTLDLADGLLHKLEPAAPLVAPTFRTVRPVLTDASALLDRAVPLLRVLRPAATSLAGAARRGVPLVRQLTPSVHRLQKTTLPSLNAVAPDTKKRTSVMIGGTFAGLAAGVGGQFDGNGHFIRFPATVGSSPLDFLPCQLYVGNPDAGNQLLACQNLGDALSSYLNYNPTGPVPGTADGPPINTARKGTR